ncbi:hypothetical protein [Burkholderia seminalis]|uniref:Uncharacterized protein n=1 Tax=Burkholderia seminalis TaxID=488731 RepID=A0A8A8D7R6_9BURK|nr:hypothetical protein [Burkholderia seminalis]QTO20722.1 hypothetical protein DT99_025620 [Burkholderia seminalis]
MEPYHDTTIARSNLGSAEPVTATAGAIGELTLVFARSRPVTTLIRNAQPHEFPSVSHLLVNVNRRSDNFASRTVTSLI